jgi:hypothetical protein
VADGSGRLIQAAALALTVVGLGLLYRGLADASPLTWGYSEAERDAAHTGRVLTAVAAAVLLVAAGLMAADDRWARALVVAAPGVICLILALAFRPPGGAWAFIAFVPLALAALVAALPIWRG